ncbi:hypothetical protein Runsl_2848 [Runella slithyformis DSM 19594]|uniref:Uncharacterized protein n=1 Tax=Runella slithyformis (strain ATCC 29530 / DSM 19594 / LMG 11500 / NCIMB 11436 / LSU 4) TaxID=761193 RepID=A0A7U3ZL82_RUNSL|nr:hypothetical protein Runsl_2848 [Runella slithyformis DSM 19594]
MILIFCWKTTWILLLDNFSNVVYEIYLKHRLTWFLKNLLTQLFFTEQVKTSYVSENKHKDLLPLLVILESIGKVQIYTKGFSDASVFFWADEQIRFNATLLLLANIAVG